MGGKTRNKSVYEACLLAPVIATIIAVSAAVITGFIALILTIIYVYFSAPNEPWQFAWAQLGGLIVSIPTALITGLFCWFFVFIIVLVFVGKKREEKSLKITKGDLTIPFYAFFMALLFTVLALLVLIGLWFLDFI